MARWIPFTAHIRIVPERDSRTTTIRSLQKIAADVYDELVTDTDLSLATPGGGQAKSYGPQLGGIGSMVNGMAVKPQMGQTPAQLSISGFITSSTDNTAPVPDKTVIHAGETMTGYGGNHHWDSLPKSGTNTIAASLRTKLRSALTDALGASADWQVFRLDVAGVVYGDRGLHIPTS